jgi:hypothetical protein
MSPRIESGPVLPMIEDVFDELLPPTTRMGEPTGTVGSS